MKQFDNRDIDKEFAEIMKEACLTNEESHYDDKEAKEFIYSLIKENNKNKGKRFFRSVAVIMMILFTGVTVSIWCQVDGVYGGKHLVEKCVNLISPLSQKEEIDDDGNIVNVFSIDEEQEIKFAQKAFPQLKKINYIPEGYTFDHLIIQEGNDYMTVEYAYHSGSAPLFISFQYDKANSEIMVVGESYVLEDTGRKLYIDEIDETGEYTVIEITEFYDCMVTGVGDKSMGIKIMESIEL